MHIHIITDLEGISGVDSIDHMDTDSSLYFYACKRLMVDTNAAIRGFFNGGATRVTVTDGHYRGKNFLDEELDPRAEKINLIDLYNTGIYKQVTAIAQIGAHAMAGTPNAFLDHTQSSVRWYNYYINKVKCGELAQAAAFFGAYDAPLLMVSGDLAACEEAEYFFPKVATACVKEAFERNKATLYDLDYCEALIEEKAKYSLSLFGHVKPYKVTNPIEIKVEFTRADYCDEVLHKKGVERIDARSVVKKIDKISDYLSILL